MRLQTVYEPKPFYSGGFDGSARFTYFDLKDEKLGTFSDASEESHRYFDQYYSRIYKPLPHEASLLRNLELLHDSLAGFKDFKLRPFGVFRILHPNGYYVLPPYFHFYPVRSRRTFHISYFTFVIEELSKK